MGKERSKRRRKFLHGQPKRVLFLLQIYAIEMLEKVTKVLKKRLRDTLQVCQKNQILISFFKHSCNHQNMYQGILKLICTITVVYASSEYHFYLKCTLLHCRQLFVSMIRAVSFLQLFGSFSLKLESFHVNQWIYLRLHSDD